MKTTRGPINLCNPANTMTAQPDIDTTNPSRPIAISGFRPRRSEARAQIGADKVHRSADNEKMPATRGSGMPISRPMAGRTDCNPEFPAATAIMTANTIAKSRRRVSSAMMERLCVTVMFGQAWS